MSYRYKSFRGSNRKSFNFLKLGFFSLLLLFIIFLAVSFAYVYGKHKENRRYLAQLSETYRQLYENKNYLDLIDRMDDELKAFPFKVEFLVYRGFSYYLLGEAEHDIIKKNQYFSSALLDLRRALAVGVKTEIVPDILFGIGKIYYFLGRGYYNQSIDYLVSSLNYGNERVDLLYVLGLIYSNLGRYEESNHVLKRSLDIEQSDVSALAVAFNYHKMEDYDNSIKFIEKVVSIDKDIKIKEKALMMLAEIQFERKEFQNSLDTINTVISINENNADAFYLRGDIYFTYFNDNIRARAEWRKTLSINPGHIRAYRRL